MDIKYPLYLNRVPAGSRPLGESMPRSLLTFGDKENVVSRFAAFIAASDLEFLQQLVADANNASTIQADYDRLEAKIDRMVELRVAHLREVIRTMQSSEAVNKIHVAGLENCVDRLQAYNKSLQMENRSVHEANVNVNKSLQEASFANKAMKHTIGEQKQHLRRLRAKLVKRALLAGEERAKTAAWIAEAEKLQALYEKEQRHGIKLQRQLKDIRRYMHEQGWNWDVATTSLAAIDHKDGDPKNNTPRNLAVEVRDTYRKIKEHREAEKAALLGPAFSDKMFEEAALPPSAAADLAAARREYGKLDNFYRELGELLAKSFGLPKYPFPKKGE